MRNISLHQVPTIVSEYKQGLLKDRFVYANYNVILAIKEQMGDELFKLFTQEIAIHTTPEGVRFIETYGASSRIPITRKISYRGLVIYSSNRPAETINKILDWEWNKDEIRCKMHPDGNWVSYPATHVMSIKEVKEIRYHGYGSDYNDLIEETKNMGLNAEEAVVFIRKETGGQANIEEVKELLGRG